MHAYPCIPPACRKKDSTLGPPPLPPKMYWYETYVPPLGVYLSRRGIPSVHFNQREASNTHTGDLTHRDVCSIENMLFNEPNSPMCEISNMRKFEA